MKSTRVIVFIANKWYYYCDSRKQKDHDVKTQTVK